ncbi:MAG TPA: PAS domain S-box protein [Spirochaetota bacterium]|nr:PAS domain S-box protein [Spirochaetota bacterium]HPJ33569.1 PAS domain S-box protein [Spirochaetota bacterium]
MDNTGRTILLVEDEVLIAMAEEKQLSDAGYNVITAFSGENAIETALKSEKKIDIILMDIDLGSGIDGTEAAMEILKHRDIPVLFQSSHTEKDIVEKTEKITSYGYVVKHSGITILDASIKMAFKLHKAYTDLKEKEENLLIKEMAIESSINAVALFDRQANLIYVNPSFLKLWGYEKCEEVLALPDTDSWIDATDVSNIKNNLINNGVWRGEIIARKKDGTLFDIETSAGVIFGDKDKAIGIIAAFQDITQRKISEAELRESRESFRVLVENIDSLVCEADSRGRYTYLSPAYKKVTGYEPDDLVGNEVIELLHPDDMERWKARFCLNNRAHSSIRDTWRFKVKNGDWRWMDCSVTFFQKNHNEIRAVVVSNDITERIREEAKMKKLIKENEVYLNELRERVASNSATISSFIDFLLNSFSDDISKPIFLKAESRVKFGIAIYKKFHANPEPSGINLYDYINDIISSISDMNSINGRNIKYDDSLKKIMIDLKSILPLGLILNEIITNAINHAYPDTSDGEIVIGCKSEGEKVTIGVSDNGIGRREREHNEESYMMGLDLVKKLTRDIGGELLIENKSGTQVYLTFTP